MRNYSTLSLDQSHSSTGFCLLPARGDPITGSWPLADGTSHEQRSLGYRELWYRLDAMHKGHDLGEILHEQPAFGAANQGQDQLIATIGLVAIIELFGCSRGIAVKAYPAQSWRGTWFSVEERKALRPKGKDWKHPAILRARQLGFDPSSHDEAEAIAIADHHLHKVGIQPEWRKEAGMLDMVA